MEQTVFAPGRAAIAIAVCAAERPVAAICIEGPVVAFDAKRRDRGEVARWLEIAAKVSHLAGEQADIAENHYAHLSPRQL